MNEPSEKVDFSLTELIKKQLLIVAKELFESAKKQASWPEDMEEVEVLVEVTLLKPLRNNNRILPLGPSHISPLGPAYDPFPGTKYGEDTPTSATPIRDVAHSSPVKGDSKNIMDV